MIMHACRKRNETRTKKFLEKQFGFRDETGINSTERRWADCRVYVSHMHTECIPIHVSTIIIINTNINASNYSAILI